MQKESVSIPKLIGQSNYGTWAFAMQMTLVEHDLWECTEENFSLEAAADKKRDAKARAKICLAVSEKVYPLVTKATTARETWKALQQAYADAGLVRRLTLLRKLFSIKLENYPDMEAYITNVQATHHALVSIKAGLDDEFIGIIMLAGLTEAYNPLVMALEHSGTKISSEAVTAALLKEGQRQEQPSSSQRNSTSGNGDSLLVSSASDKKKVKKPVVCFHCKKKGHYKSQCPKLKAGGDDSKSCLAYEHSDDKVTLYTSSNSNSDNWVIDSGATSHMTSNKSILKPEKSCTKTITCANKSKIVSNTQGSVELEISHEGRNLGVKMSNVLLIPELLTNLISVSKIAEGDKVTVFDKECCRIFDNSVIVKGNALLTAPLKNGLYVLGPGINKPSVFLGTELWHRRLGHLSVTQMNKLRTMPKVKAAFGKANTDVPCIPCSQGKQCTKKFPRQKKRKRANDLLELIHSDVAGPIEVESWGGARYFLLFIDDYSRKIFGYVLKSKTEVFQCFVEFKAFVENQTGKRIKKFRSDNGTEYTNKEFQLFLKKFGIQHQTSIAYTPQQNGVAERSIRTITEMTRCMLRDSGLDKKFWGEAVRTAIYLKNRSPTMALKDKVPEEVWSGQEVDLSHLRVFGSVAHVLVKDGSRKKFDPKTRQTVMVGYSENQKGYRFVDLSNPKKVIIARDAVFDETMANQSGSGIVTKPEKVIKEEPTPKENRVGRVSQPNQHDYQDFYIDVWNNEEIPGENQNVQDDVDVTEEEFVTEDESFEDANENYEGSGSSQTQRTSSEERMNVQEGNRSSSVEEVEASGETPSTAAGETSGVEAGETSGIEADEVSTERRYPLRARVPKRFEDMEYNFVVSCGSSDPVSVRDAMERSDKALWRKAMEEEYNSLMENKTWELVDRPRGINVVKCKWLFKLKIGADGEVQRHKARLVAKGYSQKWGEDYFETFAPVVKLSSIRMLFALAVEKDLKIHHIDVTTAFLNGDLEEDLYMEQPEAFIKKGTENKVCKLRKAIYGLKQAARCWNVKVDAWIIKYGFKRSKYDPCVYIKRNGNNVVAIALYVDDFYIFGNTEKEIDAVKRHVEIGFKIKDLGEAKECLGMQITQSVKPREILLNQTSFAKRVLDRYGMADSKPVSTPLEVNLKLEKGEVNHDRRYQEIIGSLMYLALGTRPDIAFAVSYLSQFNSCWNTTHMSALKRVLRYIRGSIDVSLKYMGTGTPLHAFCDADWGTNEDGHSFTGYVVVLGGASIAWQARKQRCVALSSAEAEYIAACEASKELMSLKGLLMELSGVNVSVELFSDSQSAAKLIYSNAIGRRSKHINIKYHYVRELAKTKEIFITYLETSKMPADALTKGLPRPKYEHCLRRIGLQWGC